VKFKEYRVEKEGCWIESDEWRMEGRKKGEIRKLFRGAIFFEGYLQNFRNLEVWEKSKMHPIRNLF
jgi:hypothetical protein